MDIQYYGENILGERVSLFPPVTLGFPAKYCLDDTSYPGCRIGDDAVIRSGTIIYCDVIIGSMFQCGHNVLIREKTDIGVHVSIGTNCIVEGNSRIGEHTSLQSMVYIPTNTIIGKHVFIGPNSVLTNDKYPPSGRALIGPMIGDYVSIGANATILPGIKIGYGAMVAAGAIVTKDLPAGMMAIGAPAKIRDLPVDFKRA